MHTWTATFLADVIWATEELRSNTDLPKAVIDAQLRNYWNRAKEEGHFVVLRVRQLLLRKERSLTNR